MGLLPATHFDIINTKMSERGNFRGGRGRGDRGGRGGGSDRGGRGGGGHAQGGDRKKENILDLTKYMDKEITVKFTGGRESTNDFFNNSNDIRI